MPAGQHLHSALCRTVQRLRRGIAFGRSHLRRCPFLRAVERAPSWRHRFCRPVRRNGGCSRAKTAPPLATRPRLWVWPSMTIRFPRTGRAFTALAAGTSSRLHALCGQAPRPRSSFTRSAFQVHALPAACFPLGALTSATLRRRLARPRLTTRAPTGLHPIMRALCDAGLRRLGSAFYITALCKLARLHTRTRHGLSSFPQAFLYGTLHPPLAVRSRLWQLRAAPRSACARHHPPPCAPAHALRGPALPPPNPRAGRPAAPRGTAPTRGTPAHPGEAAVAARPQLRLHGERPPAPGEAAVATRPLLRLHRHRPPPAPGSRVSWSLARAAAPHVSPSPRRARSPSAHALPLRASAAAPPPAPPAAADALRGPALPPTRRGIPTAARPPRHHARSAVRFRGPPAPAARLPPRSLGGNGPNGYLLQESIIRTNSAPITPRRPICPCVGSYC